MSVTSPSADPKPDPREDWTAKFFNEVDSFEIKRLAACFADNVEVRLGNAPPIHGKAAAVSAFTQFWSGIAGIRHRREALVQEGDSAAQQSIVTYATLDGRDVSMPVASYLRRKPDGSVDRLWIYIDMVPLFAPATQHG